VKIIFITDYFNKSGLGNYIRSRYLYKIIKKNKKYKVDFCILSKLKKKNNKYDAIILDLPNRNYNISSIIKKFSNPKAKIIGLDYNFKTKIDCNIGIFLKNKFANKNYIGVQYSLIRKEIYKYKKIKKNKDLFFISIGSSDVKNLRNKISNLFNFYFKNIYVSSIIKANKNNKDQNKYLMSMASCNLAASNGGTTLMELLFLNKIVFVYPQNILELKFSNYLKKLGFKIFINKFFVTKKMIDKLSKNRQKHGLIDQFGVNRISKIIFSSINNE
tara:strand:- start:1070 stop:1888 length:819 start_codon:yes stop_codon:yes gene_type:complete